MIGFLIGIVAFGFFKLKFNPESILLRHLEKRYNKEFVIAYKGKRNIGISSWYEAEIYPKELVGSPREKDKYYWAKGFVENGKGGDTYGKVLLNESANNFYLPKLKELFGENVLPVLDLKGGYIEEDYVKEMELRNKLYKERLDGNFNPLSGGIYIFGRVESDEEREWYRKQIYEFVQFMKQTGTFEYVELDIMIVDERILTKEFRENLLQTQNKLAKNPKTRANIEKRKERRIIMSELNDYFNKETDYSEVLNSYIKSDVLERGSSAIAKNSSLLYLRLYSPNLIISKGWNESGNPELYEEIKNYDNIQDVKFEWEAW